MRTLISDLLPQAKAWMQRALDEHLRRHGRYRDLVLRLLARRTEPTTDDLVRAWRESPLPQPIVDYIVQHYVHELPRKTGPKRPTRSTFDDVLIVAFYRHQLQKATARQRSGLTTTPATRAKRRTAAKFAISRSTLEHLLTAEGQRGSLLTSSLLNPSPK